MNNDDCEINVELDSFKDELMKNFNKQQFTPDSLHTMIGQQELVERLLLQIQGSLRLNQALGHISLVGHPGLGKSTLFEGIAKEMGQVLIANTVRPTYNVAKLLVRLEDLPESGAIVALDEAHLLPQRTGQSLLLDVLEYSQWTDDNGEVHKITQPVTFIFATTDEEKLLLPLRERTMEYRLDFYSLKEMAQIVEYMANKLGLKPTRETCIALARASTGTPRHARTLLETAQKVPTGVNDVMEVLAKSGFSSEGLQDKHLEYLKALQLVGRPLGLDNLKILTGMAATSIRECEALLIRKRYVVATRQGREIQTAGKHALQNALRERVQARQKRELYS